MAPSPRDGAQPVEHPDEALYAVLGRTLASSGTESTTASSGFVDIPGRSSQTWYHWGELWLASSVITLFGVAPLAARNMIVLPIMLLAAAAMTGTLVRQMSGSKSIVAYAVGAFACLFLAPIPFVAGPVLSAWSAGLLFGIRLYGLGVLCILLSMHALFAIGSGSQSSSRAGFIGVVAACTFPAHVVIGALAMIGIVAAATARIVTCLVRYRRLPVAPTDWQRTFLAAGVATTVTVAWAVVTGHGLVASPPLVSVLPFNATWRDTIGITILGAGLFLAIPVAWLLDPRRYALRANLYLGSMTILVVGAVVWGARLADFNMFYVFFGGIAVFATPLAAVAIWSLLARIRRSQRPGWGVLLTAVFVAQIAAGSAIATARLSEYGPLGYDSPLPEGLITAIRQLPPEAELAYSCRSGAEATFLQPQLLAFTAHTARPMVPMCFISETVGGSRGVMSPPETPSVDWQVAPQSSLYPDLNAHPSEAAIRQFLKAHGVDYIYADSLHPNVLVSDVYAVAISGSAMVLRIP
jgi:hypothetical protein